MLCSFDHSVHRLLVFPANLSCWLSRRQMHSHYQARQYSQFSQSSQYARCSARHSVVYSLPVQSAATNECVLLLLDVSLLPLTECSSSAMSVSKLRSWRNRFLPSFFVTFALLDLSWGRNTVALSMRYPSLAICSDWATAR